MPKNITPTPNIFVEHDITYDDYADENSRIAVSNDPAFE